MAPPRHKIFVSHAAKDRHRIQGLILLLRGLGHETFVDSDSIPLGSDWESRLRSELRACDTLVVMWTKNASESSWVRRECELAAKEDELRPIVPIRVDDTPLCDLLTTRQGVAIPLIDTVLETVREARSRGLPPRQIDLAVRSLLAKHGITLEPAEFDKVRTFASGAMTGLWVTPLASWLWSSTTTKAIVVAGSIGVVAAGAIVSRAEPPTLPASSAIVPAEIRPLGDDMVPAVAPLEHLVAPEPDPLDGSVAHPRECPNGIVLVIHARLKPGSTDWDLAPGDLAKPDMAGYIELAGKKERLKPRSDRSRVIAPFFAGQSVRIEGSMKLEIYDLDVNFHDPMASAQVDVSDLFTESGTSVGSLDIAARCRK